MPEKHHLYTALQAKPSPGIQTYRDALFPARQTPREAPGSSVSQSRSWSCAKQTLRASIEVMRKDHVQAACRRPKRPRSAGVAKEMKSSKEVHVPGIISRRKFPVSLLRSSSVLYKGLLYER